MASVITVNLNEVEQLAQKLNSFALTPAKAKSLLKGLGMTVEEQTKSRFDAETDPDGNKWRELTEAYAKQKREGTKKKGAKKKTGGSSGGILTFGGYLKNSVEFQLEGDEAVLIGSPMEYADYHQNAKKESRRRKFLGLNAGNIAELEIAVDEFMKRKTA
jgi:phage gpG-like protein